MQMQIDLGPQNSFVRMLLASIPAALVAGITAVIIQGQSIATLREQHLHDEGDIKVLGQRLNDLDLHGSRSAIALENRVKADEERNIEQDKRLIDVVTGLSGLTNRFVIVEDRLAACQMCHMGGGSNVITDHMLRQRSGQSRGIPPPPPAPQLPTKAR